MYLTGNSDPRMTSGASGSMSTYCRQLLNSFAAPETGVPDLFPRKSAVFKMTMQTQIKSSTANSQVAGYIAPQSFSDSASPYVSYYTDGASNLNVSNMPAFVNLTGTTTNGSALNTYYTYVRLVALGYKFTYIGAEQTAAGEFAIGLANNNLVLTTGADLKSGLRDLQFYATGRAEAQFEGCWLPQDLADLQFRSAGDAIEADKTGTWGVILFCGSGFPSNTFVYQLEVCAIVEGLVLSTVSDYIPQSISACVDPNVALLEVKRKVTEDGRKVARCSGDNWSRLYQPVRAGNLDSNPSQPYPVDELVQEMSEIDINQVNKQRGYAEVPDWWEEELKEQERRKEREKEKENRRPPRIYIPPIPLPTGGAYPRGRTDPRFNPRYNPADFPLLSNP